ncbi:MAG: carboxypeptidase-like regulatory domain-containing protein [Bacteroidales bacterium]|nr:hypothetical protein [Bacteroidales bacterium]MDD2204529.1 carboxypeptidase-like regulatory domain-containing protein [Bacteroidales bacterium]MDD3913469.1 carboxypeptidase-like regulatory domain-containing protein [Bacteroidales bacterium]MDD4633959.1 carboxypeptidase-like regulatory domain-containing protein [Bacteroidales bacterium]
MANINITDELIARYLDCDTNQEETRAVLDYIATHPEEYEALLMMTKIHALMENDNEKSNSKKTKSKKKSVYAKSLLDKDNLDDDTRYQLAGYGKTAIAALTEDDKKSCAIQAQQIILQDYGINISLPELTKIARENGWFVDNIGSPMDYVGELLNYFDISAVQMRNANIYHLMNELGQGHKIIVGVDTNDLEQSEQWRQFDNVMSGKEANHVLVVAGIDTTNPDDVKVTLTDPTNSKVHCTYPAKQFMDAWEESGYFMVATTKPAPLAYNPVSMQHFDYQKGSVEKFADLAFDEIVKRLKDNGLIPKPDKTWTKIIKYFLFCFLIPACVLYTAFLAWRYYTPIDMKITVNEDSNYKIPTLPLNDGILKVTYSDLATIPFTITKDSQTVVVSEINYKHKHKDAHIEFYADGFITIDTVLPITKDIKLTVRRNNDLGLIFGYIQDENGLPVANAVITLQGIAVKSDCNGNFKIVIPPNLQKKEQSLMIQKNGYKTWLHHRGAPSEKEPWLIVLQKN